MDYRDRLQELFQTLHDEEGLTRYRISKRAGISEQRISNLFSKRSNLSPDSLQRLLDSLGYEMRIEPIADILPGNGPRGTRLVKE